MSKKHLKKKKKKHLQLYIPKLSPQTSALDRLHLWSFSFLLMPMSFFHLWRPETSGPSLGFPAHRRHLHLYHKVSSRTWPLLTISNCCQSALFTVVSCLDYHRSLATGSEQSDLQKSSEWFCSNRNQLTSSLSSNGTRLPRDKATSL